jgi:hypothetical protein
MKCVDAKALEQYIFTRLEHFRYSEDKLYKRELFQIHFSLLMTIMSEFELYEQQSTTKFNVAMSEYYNTINALQPIDYDEIIIQDIGQYINDKFDIKPEDCYTPPQQYKSNYSPFTNQSINDGLRPYGLELVSEYTGKCEEQQTFRCLSVFNHTIVSSYSNINESKEQGCVFCRKHSILDQVPLYVYDGATYDYVTSYDTYARLKEAEPDINHQLLKNIIREERWLTPHEEKIYSILSPHANKLDLNKSLSPTEQAIVTTLGINYEIMRQHLIGQQMDYIIAIDACNNRAYVGGNNFTEFARKLCHVGTTKPLNRKTIARKIDSNISYGGYIWVTSTTQTRGEYTMIDIRSMQAVSI